MIRNEHPQGTDNVLMDLGFDDAEELTAKAALALKLDTLIDTHCQQLNGRFTSFSSFGAIEGS